jgi:molybdate transport system permease protein
LAIYERFATDFTGALALAGVLVALSGAILLTVKVFLAAR